MTREVSYELRHKKMGVLPMQKQRRDQLCSNCKADQHLCFRYSDSAIPPLLNFKISSF